MVYIAFVCVVVPLLLMLFLLEGEAKTTVGFMMLGIFMCLTAYEVNSLLNGLLMLEPFTFTTTITPISEEIIKALPILFFACAVSDKTNRVLPVAMAVGIGFAILENTYLLTKNIETVDFFWALVRGFATGLMHGISTAAVGYGFSFVRKKKKLFYTGTFGLLSAAITYHAIYNLLVQSDYSYIGFLLPIATYLPVLWVLKRKKKKVPAA